jgi:hypothetical protein
MARIGMASAGPTPPATPVDPMQDYSAATPDTTADTADGTAYKAGGLVRRGYGKARGA